MCPLKRPIEILLVEDSPTDRLIAVEALSQAHVLNNLHTVQDGVEAMEYLHREGKYASAPRPDMIILDLNLPRMDGRAVLRELKSDPRYRMIPVVVMTTSQDEQDVVRAYGLHANCFISKPVAFEAFTKVIRSLEGFWFEVVTFPPAPKEPAARTESSSSEPALRVLLIEDSPSEALLCRLALEESNSPRFMLTQCGSLAAAEKTLDGGGYDAIIADLGLPDSQGLATVCRLREVAPALPLIVLTGLDDEELGVQAVHNGAQDYISKGGMSSRNLVRAVRYAVQRERMERRLGGANRLYSLGRLISGVAHDFNNALTTIKGHASLMESDTGLSLDGRNSLEEIHAAVTRATQLSEQLLTFTRREGAKLSLHDPNKILGAATRLLRRLSGDLVPIELQLESELPSVLLDRHGFEQVLASLTLILSEAMSAGGKISFRTGRQSLQVGAKSELTGLEPGHQVCISILGTGAIIPKEIVEAGLRARSGHTPSGHFGLGLSEILEFARRHGGHFEAQVPSLGELRFELYLPCPKPAAVPEMVAAAAAPAAKRFGSECVLLVEDEKSVSNLVKNVLAQHGFEVLVAGDAAEALSLWSQARSRIRIVVSDFIMPSGMNGVDLIAQLELDSPSLPSIIVSGYGIDNDDDSVFLVPGENYLQKPYAMADLLSLIRHRLDEGKFKVQC